jgi:hypothetical protein
MLGLLEKVATSGFEQVEHELRFLPKACGPE